AAPAEAGTAGAVASGHPEAIVERRILSHEHREIEHLVGRIETTAEMAGNLASSDLASALRSLLDAMEKTLLRHLDWEDNHCFPEMDRLAGTPWTTRLLRFQHQQVREALERLEADWLALRREPTHRQLVDLRGRLYGLHAQMSSHLEQEEAVVMPFLDAGGGQAGVVPGAGPASA
ncbi:MAG: hemerythrin domain-containing protein, partial [Actinomycetota bacterium]|nr:hemerythrin domain-containing protein [Actinomycetota bacterium]